MARKTSLVKPKKIWYTANMKNKKKYIRTLKVSICILLILTVGAVGLVCGCRLAVRATDYTFVYRGDQSSLTDYDYILVPGAAVASGMPGAHLKDRLDTAAALYHSGAAKKIIVSGFYDAAVGLEEGRVMLVYLKGKDVPSTDILVDDRGYDTAETLRRAKEYVGEGRVIVCTQSLYAARTAYLCQLYGLSAVIADSDIRIYTAGVGKARLRETLAATKAVADGWFAKKSRYPLAEHPFGGGADA